MKDHSRKIYGVLHIVQDNEFLKKSISSGVCGPDRSFDQVVRSGGNSRDYKNLPKAFRCDFRGTALKWQRSSCFELKIVGHS